MGPSGRFFVALDLAEREELAAWRDGFLDGRADLRPVAADSLHVTLVFLGSQPESEVPALVAALPRARRAVALSPQDVRQVGRPPRLLSLSLGDPSGEAALLAMRVAAAFSRFREPERRPFWPHVTLARMRRGVSGRPLPPPSTPAPALTGSALTLYRSRLHPAGARYEAIESLALRA